MWKRDALRWNRGVLMVVLLGSLATISPSALGQDAAIAPGSPRSAPLADAEPATNDEPGTFPPDGKEITKIEVTPAPFFGVTGDWFGARDELLDIGIDVRPKLTQFYQGVTTGGLRQGFAYGLKFDYFGTVEAEKLFGWKGLFISLHGESRFGQSVNDNVGSYVAPNFAMLFPRPTGAASALTALQIDQFLTPDLLVTFGKLNAVAYINAHPFIGGNGIDRWMNSAFVFDPIYGRTLPYSTPGATIQYLRDGDPVFTFQVLDSNGRPDTSGLNRMFRNGASLFAQLIVPVEPFGLPGGQSLELAYTSGSFSPLSQDEFVAFPRFPAGLAERTRRPNSWVINYVFDQLLVTDDEDPSRGWGIFGSAGIADRRTNPVHWKFYFGVGGMSPLPGRKADTFGVGYYYLGVSGVLQDLLRPIAPVRDEQIFELYYNASITRWFTLTADIQAIDPGQVAAGSAFLFGMRAKIDF